MKRRNLAILIKSTYILAITFITLIGLTLAQYSWSTAWTTDTSTPTQDGNTIQAQHFTDLKNAIDAIYQIITFTLTGVNIAGDLTVGGDITSTGQICVDNGCIGDSVTGLLPNCLNGQLLMRSGGDWICSSTLNCDWTGWLPITSADCTLDCGCSRSGSFLDANCVNGIIQEFSYKTHCVECYGCGGQY